MSTDPSPSASESQPTVPAGMLPAWHVDELPPPPAGGVRMWLRLLGPGVLLAGASIGSGEWLFGPAVSAQYGATLLWLASLSIVFQVFCNLEMMRYTLYCGEPIVVGYFRSRPGPWFWTIAYVALDFASIWPFNASNAAVPLAAAILGHLPGDGMIGIFGATLSENQLVKVLGYAIFLAAFIPLIFGGTIYKMLERVMTFKLVVVLVYLIVVAVLMVSGSTLRETLSGFINFGTVPLRADTVIVGRHFTFQEREGSASYTVKGTLENDSPLVTEFVVREGDKVKTYEIGAKLTPELETIRRRVVARAQAIAEEGGFFVEDTEEGVTLSMNGQILADRSWRPDQFIVSEAGERRTYGTLEEVPAPAAARFRELIENQGLELANLVGYWREKGRLPPLDWAMLAAFAAIAGAGGLTNTLFSNYARDKGWGMGLRVGAIPSAIGGKTIRLSHVGKVFPLDDANRQRWRKWVRFIVRDQVAIWMLCSALGMALPCMLSLEFIRHAPVSGNRVGAMMAEGMAHRYPDWGSFLWPLTLFMGFLVLAPGQILAGDAIARRWADILWSASSRTRRLGERQVKYVYYGILAVYAVWGLIALTLFNPLQIAKISAVLMNVGLGFSALHSLYVNKTLLPRELRPNILMQIGSICCGLFFLGISVIVLLTL